MDTFFKYYENLSFENWLREVKKYQETTIKSRLANLAKIEEGYGSLYNLWIKDNFKSLFNELRYTQIDKDIDRVPDIKITIEGDYYNGLATYRSTLNLYSKYLEAIEEMFQHLLSQKR